MRFSILTLSLFSGFGVIAQNKPFEYKLGWKGKIAVTSIADSARRNSCVVVTNSGNLKALLFDAEMKFVKDFGVQLTDEKMLGGLIRRNEIQMYLTGRTEDEMHAISVDTQTGAVRDSVFPLELKGEKILGHMNSPHGFLYITASKKLPFFHVYRFRDMAMEKISYDLSLNDINKKIDSGNLWTTLSTAAGLSRTVNLALVDSEVEPDVEVASSHNKLYLVKNRLALVMDESGPNVQVIEFDLDTKKAGYREIRRPFEAAVQEQFMMPEYNSYLIGDRFYSVEAGAEALSLTVQDFDTGRLLKTFRTLKDDTISFKNTPIIQEGGYVAHVERNLDKTKQLLRKMLNSSAVITVSGNREGQHEVTVGAYKKISGGGGGFRPGMGYGMGAGMSIMVYYPGFGSSWNKTVRFKSLIDPATAAHIPGAMQTSVSEQIQKYTESLNLSSDVSSVFIASEFYQFAYFDKAATSLVVIKF